MDPADIYKTHGDRSTRGFAVECDEAGIITRVLCDRLGLEDRLQPGRPLSAVAERDSRAKTHHFILAVRSQRAAFDWEINVPLADAVITLRFAGVVQDGTLLIVAAPSDEELMALYEALAGVSNEQTNLLRASLKEHTAAERFHAAQEAALYDELSRLNNELADAQRQLAKQNAELERLNALKNQFLGMAAHDLRNPLAVILAYSEFLLDDLRDSLSATHVEFLEAIQSSARFMLQLVNDLLDVSIIESGRLELNIDAVDLTELVRRSIALNQVLAERKRITITLRVADEISLLFVDPNKIRQVLDNLLSNAIKYSQENTGVLVTLRRCDREVLLTVTDQGQGIPSEEIHKLFQWLSKTSVKSTAGEKSSGLGLAIARRIVEGHKGRLWAESEVGKGTTFYVALPIAGEEQAYVGNVTCLAAAARPTVNGSGYDTKDPSRGLN